MDDQTRNTLFQNNNNNNNHNYQYKSSLVLRRSKLKIITIYHENKTMNQIVYFKIDIKAQIFHNLSQKMNRLCHKIESVLSDNIEGITSDMIEGFINEYDNLNESLEFGLIDYINNKVKDLYKDVKTLPSSLNCVGSFMPSDIVIAN